MEKQSLICTQKTSFYMDNITSTLTIVVFSINWSRMFALYVRQMCCKLELKTLNNWKMTASLRNHRKRRVCSDPCICTTQRYSFFFSEVLHEIWRIFPWSFDIVVISSVPTRYLIFCTKQTRKQSLFYRQHPEHHVTFPSALIFSAAWCLFVWKHQKVCCSLLQWCDVGTVVWCRTCTAFFQEFSEIIFKFSADLGVRNESTVKSGILPRRRFETRFFLYLVEYSVKDFIMTRQYLVNVMCNCWFRMCTQFHQKLVSYKCMLFVDCLVVLQKYFVNWARVTKL